MKITKEHIGKRVLANNGSIYNLENDVTELKILEISPSGERVKLRYLSDAIYWKKIDEYKIVEVLEDVGEISKTTSVYEK